MHTKVQIALPNVGDVPFLPFTSFSLLLFGFACFTDVVLVSVTVRGRMRGQPLPLSVEALNYVWIAFQAWLFADLVFSYRRYYRPRERDVSTPRIGDSNFYQPKCWTCTASLLGIQLTSQSYLLWLALLLPLNALLFYGSIAQPIFFYDRPPLHNQESRLVGYNVSELLDSWPEGGNLTVHEATGNVTTIDGSLFDPPVVISSRNCYATDSGEFLILGRMQGEDFPKQAYCETLIGTLMVDSHVTEKFQKPWMSNEDRWDEAFDFSMRLFSSLAGLIADQMHSSRGHGEFGLYFLRDMTDVYDMYMLSFADVVQMHEGRPLLSGADFSIYAYSQSFHMQVAICIWIGVTVVILRALAISGVQPFIWLLRKCGCTVPDAELRKPIDAALSLVFIEVPFLALRFRASWDYGVPVSVMAVKNSLGIFEDLYLLGVGQGFVGAGAEPRGLALCCRRPPAEADAEAPPSAPTAAAPEPGAAPVLAARGGDTDALAAKSPVVHHVGKGILLPEGY